MGFFLVVHRYLPQANLVEYCRDRNIQVVATSPLGSPGRPTTWDEGLEMGVPPPNLLRHAGIELLSDKLARTPAQILLRYQLERVHAVVVKSAAPQHIQSNADLFNWALSERDMHLLGKLAGVDWRYNIPRAVDKDGVAYFRDEGHMFFPFAQEVLRRRREAAELAEQSAEAERKTRERNKKGGDGGAPNVKFEYDGPSSMRMDRIAAQMAKLQESLKQEM